ncbi:hypothetical protein RIVM261_069830 [Rivularia sp. IAM M-261]|nr:hypothetical protein RIVM261_069830 [Rivularia sp. IAM M-261]
MRHKIVINSCGAGILARPTICDRAFLKPIPQDDLLNFWKFLVDTINIKRHNIGKPGSPKIMNIQLKPEDEQLIQIQIARGKYGNAEEVVSKALKLLDEWEKGYQNWVEEARQKVEVAAEQLDRGEGIDGEVVVARLREKLRKAKENQA